MTGPSVSDLYGAHRGEVARIILRHERRQAFRPLFLVELALAVLLFVCAIPFILLVTLLAGDLEIEPPTLRARMYRHWQVIVVELMGADNTPLASHTETPRTAAEADALVASILEVAHRERLVVVQLIAREHAATWYLSLIHI